MRKLFFLIALFSLLGFNFAYQENKEDITDNYKDAVVTSQGKKLKLGKNSKK